MTLRRRELLPSGSLALAGASNPAKQRELVFEIQRYLAKQQYYTQLWSAVTIAVWEGALKNYGPNHGYDYGGRLQVAWLDR
jgi:ABC-type transport system substrate-binding protein